MNQQLNCEQYTTSLINSISSLGMENPNQLIVAFLAKLTMVRNSAEMLNHSVILVNSRTGDRPEDELYRRAVKTLAKTLIPDFEKLKRSETDLLDYLSEHKMSEISKDAPSSDPPTSQRHNGWGGQ